MASCAVIVAPLRARSTLRERRYQIPSHEAHEPLLGRRPHYNILPGQWALICSLLPPVFTSRPRCG